MDFTSLVLVAAAACGGDSIEQLRLNDIQAIGTHNSYKQHLPAEELAVLRALYPKGADSIDYGHRPLTEQLDSGMRQVELDIYDDPEGGRFLHPLGVRRTGYASPPWPAQQLEAMARPGFKIMHLADIDFRSSCVTWSICLQTLKSWSAAHPQHTPILVTVNAKDVASGLDSVQPLKFNEAAFDRLDAETRAVLPGSALITPDDVQGSYPTLRQAVMANQWPVLARARGRFIFVLDETPEKVADYRGKRTSLEGRAMFVATDERSPLASVLIMNDPVADASRIAQAVAAGFIVRTRADADTWEARGNDTKRREAAFRSGAQYISTDYFEPDARFGSYQVRFDHGEIARINPVRATACREIKIE